jgi:hypothetical protein
MKPAFKAHRNGVNLTDFTVPAVYDPAAPGIYNLVPFTTLEYNRCNRFIDGKWYPVSQGEESAIVTFGGQIWVSQDGNKVWNSGGWWDGAPVVYDGSRNAVARVFRNGQPESQTLGARVNAKGPYINDWICSLEHECEAHAGDYFEVLIYAVNAKMVVDGFHLHTWWTGRVNA